MEIKSNIQDVIDKLEKVKEAVSGSGTTPPDFSDAMFGALNTGMGLMKRRIFNMSMDAEGEPLGKYVGKKGKFTNRKFNTINPEDPEDKNVTKIGKAKLARLKKNAAATGEDEFTEYEKKRLAHGRQIEKKDIEFDGVVRRNIEIVKDVNKVVIAFTNPDSAKIARYQEQQIGNIRAKVHVTKGKAPPARIFSLSREEFDQVKEQGKRNIVEVIKKLIKEK